MMGQADGIGCPRCFAGSPEQAWEAWPQLPDIETLVDESHFSVRIGACAGCGQRFVKVMCERVDWQGGNDPQTWFLVPIDAGEARALAGWRDAALERAICALSPKRRCLVAHFPAQGVSQILWSSGPSVLAPHD